MVDDLRSRLARTRRIRGPWADDGARGLPAAVLDQLLERWATGFDWSDPERRIEEQPWESVPTRHGELRLIHRRSAADAPVVVLLHGWPDSVLRFERLLPLLSDLNVVVPALPGYPFSAPLHEPGMSVNRIADMVADAVCALGYPKVVLSGGDVGGAVAEILAAAHPDLVSALHLTNVAAQHAAGLDPSRLAPDVAAFLDRSGAWFRTDGGYIAEQATRPSTLAVALVDSPAGLAAWLAEKLISWSGDDAFTTDELLTWITAYWATGTIGTSFTTYTEPAVLPDRVETPTVLSVFAHDTKPEPRGYAELFLDLRAYVAHPVGGHFAAWEQPDLYAQDLRRAVELGR